MHQRYWVFDGKILSKEGYEIYSLRMDWWHLSQGITKDIEAATTSRLSTDTYQKRLGNCWYIICGWCCHFIRSCNFKPQESGVIVHFYGGTARRSTIGNGQDQSGRTIEDVEVAVAAVAVAVAAAAVVVVC